MLKKRFRTLLIPYILWTLLNVILFFIAQSIPQTASFFQNENNIIENWKLNDWLNLFWVHDSDFPFVYQFWFVRDLIVLIIISPILNYICKRLPFLMIVVMTLCYMNGLQMGFGTAIFFYMSGWYFAEYKISFFKIADKIKWFEYFILLILILISNICFHEEIKFNGISTIISCLFFLKLSGKIIKNEKLFGVTSYFSGFSFFLYAIHTPFLGTSLNKISFKIIPLHGIWCLVQFIVPCIICIVVGTVLGIFLKKICMTLFMAFNGGRK